MSRRDLEVGVILLFGWIIPGAVLVLAIDWLVRRAFA